MDKPPAARVREPTNALVFLLSLATAWHSTKTRHSCGIGSFLQRALFHLLDISIVLLQIRRLPWRGGCWHLLYTDQVDWKWPPATLKTMKAPLDAIEYNPFTADAKMRDLIVSIHVDESFHRELNHTFIQMPLYEPITLAIDRIELI